MASNNFKSGWWAVLSHSVRTAIAATASFLIARLFRLPEAYWAPITTLVITQSSLGTALAVSWQRFVGTILGALVGAVVAAFGPHVLVFWHLRIDLGFSLHACAFGQERLPLRWRYTRDRPSNTPVKPSVANRATPICRGIHWAWRCSVVDDGSGLKQQTIPNHIEKQF